MSTYYSGRVQSVVFSNAAQNFYILRMILDVPDEMFGMDADLGRPIVVRGSVPGLMLEAGSWFGFEAKWTTHEKYGRQLLIDKAPVFKGGLDSDTAISMLAAHGVGVLVCRRLADHFKDQLVVTLDAGDEGAVALVPGMTPFSAAHVLSRWRTVKAYFQTLDFLAEAGVPKHRIAQVWSEFGDDAQKVLSTNPWALVRIDGITFPQADEVALKLGLSLDSPLRMEGAVFATIRAARGLGHLYRTTGEVSEQAAEFVPGITGNQVAQALVSLHKADLLVLDRKTSPGIMAVYEPWMYTLEVDSARMLRERARSADPLLPLPPLAPQNTIKGVLESLGKALRSYPESLTSVGVRAKEAFRANPKDLMAIAKAALEDWSAGSRIMLAPPQMQGVLNALTAPVSILTGLPGTGKSTSLSAVVAILRDAGVPFLLVAPTGIAAKRMASLTGSPAYTIHRAFGAKGWGTGEDRESTYVGVVDSTSEMSGNPDGSGEEWEYGPDNPHPARVLISDESSMMDQHLLYRILQCTDPACRLVFVGDAAQLPSVGPGNVLRDMLAADMFPTVRLTEIFRQGETSGIVLAAHAVHRGEMPQVKSDKNSDFLFLEMGVEEGIVSSIVRLAQGLASKKIDFQVMSPRHAGVLGVTNLNNVLREALNPQSSGLNEIRLGSETVRENDRVMVVKNNYRLGVFNGDIGRVARIDKRSSEVEIQLQGPPEVNVRMSFKDAIIFLRLAYAVTTHKSQGQEYEVILMPVVRSFHHQLQRNLFYTGITRAKKRVFLFGQWSAFGQAVANNREDVRNTLFRERLLQGGSDQQG